MQGSLQRLAALVSRSTRAFEVAIRTNLPRSNLSERSSSLSTLHRTKRAAARALEQDRCAWYATTRQLVSLPLWRLARRQADKKEARASSVSGVDCGPGTLPRVLGLTPSHGRTAVRCWWGHPDGPCAWHIFVTKGDSSTHVRRPGSPGLRTCKRQHADLQGQTCVTSP